MRQDIIFNKSNLYYYKIDIMELLVREPLAKNNIFRDLLLTSVGNILIPPHPLPIKTVTLPLTDNGNNIYYICLEWANSRFNSNNKNGQDKDNIRDNSNKDKDYFRNNNFNINF